MAEMKDRIKKLYDSGAISIDELLGAVEKLSSFTFDDVLEIVGSEQAADVIKTAKIAEISRVCGVIITNGIDIELNEETVHFNLSIEDQSNINNLFRVVELGGTEFPYQADGGVCRVYTAAEIVQIYIAAQTHITTQTTYHNALKSNVQSLSDTDKISAVTYGMTLPKKYRAEIETKLSVAQGQMNAIIARLSQAVTDDTQ